MTCKKNVKRPVSAFILIIWIFVLVFAQTSFAFAAEASDTSMPQEELNIKLQSYVPPSNIYPSSVYPLSGIVVSNYPITKIEVKVYNSAGKKEIGAKQSFSADDAVTEQGLSAISKLVMFEKLKIGRKRLQIIVTTANGQKIASDTYFTVVSVYTKIRVPVLPDLQDYFKDSSYRFYFKKISTNRRDIKVYNNWSSKNIVRVVFLKNNSVWVNKKAAPAFKKAFDIIRRDRISVKYKNGKVLTGSLASLCPSGKTNGAFVPRMVSGTNNLSHHSFGTAVDINADIKPHNNDIANRKIILAAIDKVNYLGKSEKNGIYTYNFEYNGNPPSTGRAVPNTLLNYMYYEIAFRPNGFYWGAFFSHTSDAMHFTVSEKSKLFDDYSKYQKVE